MSPPPLRREASVVATVASVETTVAEVNTIVTDLTPLEPVVVSFCSTLGKWLQSLWHMLTLGCTRKS